MSTTIKSITVSLCLVMELACLGQQKHELALLFGLDANLKVSFYDFEESETKIHNFEWEQSLLAENWKIGWSYPINGFISLGWMYARSVRAILRLKESDAGIFLANVAAAQPPELVAGTTALATSYQQVALDINIRNLIRPKKINIYLIVRPSWNHVNVRNSGHQMQTSDDRLRSDLNRFYRRTENLFGISAGFGVAKTFKSGFSIKFVEILWRHYYNAEDSILLSPNGNIIANSGISFSIARRS